MTAADWRALIEAYLDGRLSPEAFARRFIEGVRNASGGPEAIADLYPVVEAFNDEAQREDGYATNDDDMRMAASRALSALRDDEPALQAQTFDRTRAREEFRRFQVQMTGCAGIGCAIFALWIGLCVLQIYYVSEWIQTQFDWGAWPSAVLGFILAFVPIIGNVLAFLGATQEGWATWAAAIVFFAAPAATLLSGWSRWRRSGPPGG